MKRGALTAMLRPPSRRETTRALGSALAIAAICWYFGVDAWHAILLGCAITVAALACLAVLESPEASDLGWRARERPANTGSRSDVSNLASSLHAGEWGLVGLTAERRLRQIALRRLALEGLDLRDDAHRPAIEQRIGRRAYKLLASGRKRRMRLGTLMYCLDELDAVDPNHYPAPRAAPARSRLIPISLGRARER